MSKNHSGEAKTVRLQKYIADCGITSRRKAENLILEGKIHINGKLCRELGTKVDPIEDTVSYNGEVIHTERNEHIYIVLNKPRGYMTTVSDPEGRKTVMDLTKPIKKRIYPVGRLDYLSEGLLLMTNDGDFSNIIMHPRFEIVKTYEVKVFGKVNDVILKKLRAGIKASDGVLKPESVRIIEQLPKKTWLEFRLKEGKNREIRRICEACGVTIDKLRRVAIGGLSITNIKPGEWSYITKNELYKFIGINKDGSKRSQTIDYVSMKKSINVKKSFKVQKSAELANTETFSKYKKENYFETIRIQKEVKIQQALQKKMKEEQALKVVPSYQKTNPPNIK